MERNKPKDVIDALRCKLLDFFVSSQHRGLPCKATEALLFEVFINLQSQNSAFFFKPCQ